MIEHVFVVMLENRSFDHMLGFAGLRGVDTRTGQPTAATGLTGSESNRLPSGVEIPVSAGAGFVLAVDPGHEFDDVLEQLAGPGASYPGPDGRYPSVNNSGFASRMASQHGGDGTPVMKVFRPDQVPVICSLASEFAVCDHWFSSLPGPTWPNRCFVHAASSGGLDDSPSALRSAEAIIEGYKFTHGTIFDALDRAELDWSVVEGDALPQTLSLNGMLENVLRGRFQRFPEFVEKVNDPSFKDSYVFIEPHYGHVLADGRNFKCGNSQHPLDDVTRGEKLLKDVYETIRNSPHWPTSLLIVLYDEHGGFHDHVPPPSAIPPGDEAMPGNSRHGFKFDQLGVRVPAVVVSPYTRRGSIDHDVHDHSSLLATLEHLFDLEPLTQRDAGAVGLEHLFALTSPRQDAPTTLPSPAVSGVPDCENDLEVRLAGELETVPEHLTGALEPALVGFLHVGVARELHLAALVHRDVSTAIEREKDRILSTYGGIHNKFDAVRYLRDIERRYQSVRNGGSPGSG